MSVVHHLPPGWLLDHLSFINKVNYQLHQHQKPFCSKNKPTSSVYVDSLQRDPLSPFGAPATCFAPDSTTVSGNEDEGSYEVITQKYVFRSELFNVTKPYITPAVHKECQQTNKNENLVTSDKQEVSVSVGKKRKRCVAFNQGELDAMEYHTKIREMILDGSSQLIQEGLRSGFLYPLVGKQDGSSGRITLPLDACNLSELCEMAKHLPSLNEMELQTLQLMGDDISVIELDLSSQIIENNSSFSKMITLMGQKYLLPPKSSFLLSDISCMQPLLNCSKTFDVIVIDPPWENKSVKRSNRYSSLSPQQIKQMPVPKLAAADCLIVTWVTNRQKHLCFVKEELYPSWSVEVVAEWYWVKITNSGEFVFPLDSPHKKPYECLVLGRVKENTALSLRNTDVRVPPVPDHKLIVSVPCVLHSHKPPLAEVLKDYIKPGGQCLELFARNLQPGWMSWGNEVLKFQHMDYFIALEARC
ncbi:N(6)-adenine-specific methyltransferase METTL4 [Apodemus sylvaticus]|uniref:N(6)-adenine-specific methyltransferase METTL4 n=1 Tax=Apodemus sylvaticus TaxID=10129 RepID=UPI002244DFCD|nr:N(6)-adenine-specific methyltransferase METTL4 [Apodemus sylvaticus]XP_052049771.1 N(6)-adenine-specific methyltransferase METTL4 [Apodemus sylvaticus]